MEELKKLLEESDKRLRQITDLVIDNMTGEERDLETSKLYDIAKEMDIIKRQTKMQEKAMVNCKKALQQVEEPWNCVVQDIFDANLEQQDGNKTNEKFSKALKKYVEQKLNLQGNGEMEVVEERQTAIDPWTKQPIQQAVQSRTCKHLYDKRSIDCINRKRHQFRCPYVGCQNIVSIADLIDMDLSD